MRILMFGWEFPPFSSGGLGTHCYGLTKALHQKGVDVTFVMPKIGKDFKHNFIRIIHAEEGKFIEIASNLTPYMPSFDVKYSPPEGKGGHLYGMDFFQRVGRYTQMAARAVRDEPCDVIHCHDWMTFMAGIKVKEEKHKPLVVTVHSTEFDRSPLNPNPWITHVEWQGMYAADRIITVSEYMKRRLVEKYSVPEAKITVVYNAVDAEALRGPKVRFGLDEKVVLFLGRMTMQKGPDYFLRAARKVVDKEKGTRFVMVGTGHMLPELINQSIQLGLSDKVLFTGYADSVEEYYRMADVYVMPSVSEPFGIAALEAMAAGAPVIISKQSGVSEVVRHCMKVDFWDIDEMANKIIGILRYKQLKYEMERNGTMEAGRINWLSTAEKTAAVYLGLLGG